MPDTGASTKPLLASGKDNEGSLETDSAIREPSNPGRTATDLHRTISHSAAWAGSCTAVDAELFPVVPGSRPGGISTCSHGPDQTSRISGRWSVYTGGVSKHLVDLDEQALSVAQARLGTRTIKDTVNAALRRAGEDRDLKVAAALDVLGHTDLVDRVEAWR